MKPHLLILAAALCAAPAFAAPAASGGGDQAGSIGTTAPVPHTGAEVYVDICQACHMADAKGGTGAATIPALAANPRLAAPAYPITMVLKGRGAMPPFAGALSSEQIADVVAYIRSHFGNNYPGPVTAEDVAKLAPKP